MKAGEASCAARKRLAHGAWLPWLEERCGVTDRQARNYIAAGREPRRGRGKLEARGADLSIKGRAAPDQAARRKASRAEARRAGRSLHAQAAQGIGSARRSRLVDRGDPRGPPPLSSTASARATFPRGVAAVLAPGRHRRSQHRRARTPERARSQSWSAKSASATSPSRRCSASSVSARRGRVRNSAVPAATNCVRSPCFDHACSGAAPSRYAERGSGSV